MSLAGLELELNSQTTRSAVPWKITALQRTSFIRSTDGNLKSKCTREAAYKTWRIRKHLASKGLDITLDNKGALAARGDELGGRLLEDLPA